MLPQGLEYLSGRDSSFAGKITFLRPFLSIMEGCAIIFIFINFRIVLLEVRNWGYKYPFDFLRIYF